MTRHSRTGNTIDGAGRVVNTADGYDPFNHLLTAEYTPLVERKPLPGLSLLRDRVEPSGGAVTVSGGEIAIDGTAQRTALYTRARGRYLPGLYGLAGIGVRADWSAGSFQYGFGDDVGNRVGMEWADGAPYTFVESFGSRYYRKPRSEWIDPLDGTGPSGLSMDLSQHVLRILIGWYGYLRVEFYVAAGSREKGDRLVLVDRAETPPGVTFEQPDLPIFAEADGATLYVGGRQYGVYGRYNPEHRITGAFGAASDVGTTLTPILSFRAKSDGPGSLGVPVLLSSIAALSTDDSDVVVIVGGDLTDAQWRSIDGISASETVLEVDTAATAVAGGYQAYADIVSGGQGNNYSQGQTDMPDFEVPTGQPVTLAMRSLSGTTSVRATLRMREEW